MAKHLSDQIVDALKATLLAASTAAKKNVFVDQPDDLTTAMTPAIVLRVGDEQVSSEGVGLPYLQTRTRPLEIIAICTGSGSASASRDLGREIEVALYASVGTATAGGLARPIELLGASPQLEGQAADLSAQLRQTWRISYSTLSGSPDQPA